MPPGVVVTGMGVVSAIGRDVPSFTEALRGGRTGITDPAGARITGWSFPDEVHRLRELPARLRDRATRVAARSPLPLRVAVVAALQAWASAELHDRPLPPERVGLVVAGSNLTARYCHDAQAECATRPGRLRPSFALRALDTDHVGTLSAVLGTTGEGCTVGGASASGSVGLVAGARLVSSGEVDACLVVGAMLELGPLERRALTALGAMAPPGGDPTAMCRPFDAGRRGFVPGEGSACLVLESAATARRRGVAAVAAFAGGVTRLAANNLADPDEEVEAAVIAGALRRAGVRPHELSYVNGHGSASPLGDATEVRALRAALGVDFRVPVVNSTKGLTGHCLTAAGVVEAVAAVVQLDGGFAHPNANLDHPIDPEVRFAGPVARSMPVEVALSSSFGFGGFNSAVVFTRPAG
ncbi:beta-ketoacyl synthase N-terminal-like domain-containing protein [Saccharothrix coeruleofusca]|uniref:Polyketide biosynthesis malonyl-ACP decarboxylase PksF n=1 Tax=Saccharothrix coeruleofusca TaxID=33919 RepID=A0A918ANV0_9PSEU|nr:beta-ketoacyl synthase N-terminal-like domain-containing protein [Saccharothrix coeruleofusca]GGP51624.1 polyketide biosynthesis malonyl-ACP decarboxylase PksF [Saccharothrix coeruleofusca]GGP84954.1 polyketide biosynthesis malonyl-ACP decarboxylase PksF [Saccharothrix coeruleofusca]